MSWIWIIGPVVVALLFVLTDRRDKRRDAEIERWRTRMGSPKSVNSLGGPYMRMLLAAGAGQRVGYYELVPKIAYLALLGGDAVAGSDQHTVVAKLDESAPTFTVRPLPILDGQLEANVGVQFKKDTEFMETFSVDRYLEGSESVPQPANDALDKQIRQWLSPPVRQALLELPDAWLRVDGKMLALTLYGPADADKLNDLVTAADTIFAEYGAEGGPSLFGDDEEEDAAAAPPKRQAASKKASASKSA
ncbi:Hypothetical protein A7982_10158 [Minicystis rosea]|nr:Hypothetical protein A7982_10158 [Minicystis rosea]